MKSLLYIVIGILFILVTFFGIGPVIMADGPMDERMITLLVVVVLYILLFLSVKWVSRRYKGNKK